MLVKFYLKFLYIYVLITQHVRLKSGRTNYRQQPTITDNKHTITDNKHTITDNKLTITDKKLK
jgi:ribose 5-phosphate isomerase